jgi:hypothetical protein
MTITGVRSREVTWYVYDLRRSQRWLWRMSSSGIWRCVHPGLTDVSEERIASIFRVKNPRAGNQRQQVAADWANSRRHQLTFTQPYPSPLCWFSIEPILPPSLFLHSWFLPTAGSVCSNLLTLVSRSRVFLPWRWRRYVPPKRRLPKIYTTPHSRRRHSSTWYMFVPVGIMHKNGSFSSVLKSSCYLEYRMEHSEKERFINYFQNGLLTTTVTNAIIIDENRGIIFRRQ